MKNAFVREEESRGNLNLCVVMLPTSAAGGRHNLCSSTRLAAADARL
jgi:hypothetical protein